jgi:signal transduction histidine kinase
VMPDVTELNKPGQKFHSLSRRIVWQFCIFTLLISLLYSLISFVLMYTLEDSFIEKDMLREAAYLSSQYQQSGNWPEPRSHTMQLHFSSTTYPDDMRASAIAEPERKEFYGQQGRHYHLYHLPAHSGVSLLAEVSTELLVRPIRGGVLQFLAISGLLISSIACLIAWLVSRNTTRPLKQLAQLVGGAAPQQLPDKFSRQFPNNEVGILARTLEHTFCRMAQALEREKCFTRDVSHELRTPLAVIKNAVELCHSQAVSSSTDNAVLQRIYDAADQIEKAAHTLLVLAREQHAPGKHSATRLMPLLEKAILDNRILLNGKQIEIDINDNCDVSLNANPDMLKVLLDNILSNAFKYTESGTVSIAFIANQLQISDTGPGIEPAICGHITDAGVKGSQSTGFGFGLSIVKRLCEHQGWQMAVESTKGTTVTVFFPP